MQTNLSHFVAQSDSRLIIVAEMGYMQSKHGVAIVFPITY